MISSIVQVVSGVESVAPGAPGCSCARGSMALTSLHEDQTIPRGKEEERWWRGGGEGQPGLKRKPRSSAKTRGEPRRVKLEVKVREREVLER
jgi:hypothetical protein